MDNTKFIKKVAKPLAEFMNDLGMDKKDWCIGGEYAWILHGYDVSMRENHIDFYVKESKLPWPVRNRLQTIPPKNTHHLEVYSDFIENHHVGLHMVPLPKPGLSESLIERFGELMKIGNVEIQVINPLGNLYDLDKTLSYYDWHEFGNDRLTRWKKYMETVVKESKELGHKNITKKAQEILDNHFKGKRIYTTH
jgi:hypothetical protein